MLICNACHKRMSVLSSHSSG
uniref:Uncharacterized protein n=1 Tax=Anguilla anguilla TaxID=7936 RepID=A0A0E9S9L4_ANGAN